MRLLNNFIDKIPENSLKEYREFLRLYHYQQTIDIDRKLSVLASHNQELLITSYLKDKVTSYVRSGTTTSVFRVGDEVLKLSLKKHEPDTERELFLIAPTNLQVIYDQEEKPILYIEKQPYLSRQYHGQEMTSRDVINFMEELDRQGFEVTDPHCISGSFDNFGFLNDYHEANITGFQSVEDLPNWFKERPIVLYDVDLIYRKGVEKKKTFS